MATANPPPGALSVEHHNGADPFLAAPHDAHRQRYSAFDNSQFSLYLNGSPLQAKRALQAHLAETTRRLQETSHLGSALVQQRKELEDKLRIVHCLEGLAGVGGKQGQGERAARLFGAAEALREAIGAPLPPVDRLEHERSVALARTQLPNNTSFATAWAAGRGLTLDAAIAEALDEASTGPKDA